MTLDSGTIATIITILGATISTLIMQIAQWMREGRKHKWEVDQMMWDRKDRQRVAQDMKDHADRRTAALATKIDENTEISVKAFDVANNVNEKLVAIGEARMKAPGVDHHLRKDDTESV